ncbi:MAG: carboxypeptidase regulatory-like domain-containing protein [Acidobacteriota bacterium]
MLSVSARFRRLVSGHSSDGLLGAVSRVAVGLGALVFAFGLAVGAATPALAQTGDTVPPTIEIIEPPEDFVATRDVRLVIAYDDAVGVDLATVAVSLDGDDILPLCRVDAASTACLVEGLSFGPHTVEASVRDFAGNPATTSRVITVDLQGPNLDATSSAPLLFADGFETGDLSAWGAPQATVYTNDTTPAVVIVYSDAGVGVDLSTLRVSVDGVDILASCTVGPQRADCQAPELAEGPHPVAIELDDLLGNRSSASRELVVDITPPTIGSTVDPPANSAGWHQTPVDLSYECTDALSGIAVCPGMARIDSEGAGQVFVGVAVDRAGNTASITDTLSIDRTPPVLVAAVAPQANAVGWHDGPVTVSFTCEDPLSGVPRCPEPVVVDTEGAGQVVDVSISDRAGNSASASVSISLDASAPTIVATVDPPANAAGWHNGPVTVSFDCQDALSGIDTCPPPEVISSDGAGQLVEGIAVDLAGNQTTTSVSLSIDTEPPVFSPDDFGPAPCPELTFELEPEVRACFDDVGSGVDLATVTLLVDGIDRTAASTIVASCISWTPSTPLAPGEHTGQITAADIAGTVGSASWCFEVASPSLTLAIDTPEPNQLTRDDFIDVTGTVDPLADTVEVNGVAATITSDTFAVFGVPLREGKNVLSAVARNAVGAVGTASVVVDRDTTPPVVRIETPRDGAVLTSLQVDVAGLVNDLTTGTTINADDCDVFVNGVEAMVANRSFLVPNLLLKRGANTLVAEARDRLGNSSITSIDVTVQDQAGQRIVLRAGNNQSTTIFDEVDEPLVVALETAAGDPVVGQPVTFEVSRGDGSVRAFPQQGRSITVLTDDVGHARAFFRVGGRSGAGNNRVLATAPGFLGEVEFCAEATPRVADQITTLSGNNQVGVAERNLPLPLVALVTDAGGNPVAGVDVTFEVLEGGGMVALGQGAGTAMATLTTDLDGLASVVWALGPDAGLNNQSVRASFPGVVDGATATFVATAEFAGRAEDTRLSGLVLDNQDNPLPGATVHIAGTSLTTTTDANGRFSLAGVPVGAILFEVDGSTTTRDGVWPHLEYELTTVAGQDNSIDRPVYMVELDADGSAPATASEDITLTLDNVPGAELTVFGNSVTCPDGSTDCEITVTQVRAERVPMEPPLGSSFMLAWTIQPADATFDPPARLCIPNADHPVGSQVEMFSFDHDQGAFVAVGTATVQPDGTQICSDPGFGVFKAGWHGCVPPPPPPTCTSSCDDGNPCTSDRCENGSCVHDPVADGTTCDDGSGCGEGVCMAGSCDLTPLMDDGAACDDGDACTQTDTCQAGACVGEDPLECDDGNECTDDTCEPAFGCDFVNNTAPCDDGDLCTLDDACADGACMAGMPKECDDDDVCSIDSCDPATGDCTTEVDPGMDGMSCGDGSMCGDSLCVMGVCEDQTQQQDGMMCDDMDMCTDMDMCMDGMCIGEPIDFGSSGWVNDSTFTADLKIPSSVVGRLNSAIQRVPGLSGVTFKEARVGVRGRARDCCDEMDGLKPLGTKEASATGVLTADIRGIPLWGPPTFSREIDFGLAIISVDFEVGVRFDVNFRINGEIGRSFSECTGEDCSFASFNASLDPQFRVTLDAILCTDTIWTSPSCGGLETSPAAIRFNFRLGATLNRPCGSGLDGFATLGRVVFRSEFKLGIPGSERFVFEFEIFPGF